MLRCEAWLSARQAEAQGSSVNIFMQNKMNDKKSFLCSPDRNHLHLFPLILFNDVFVFVGLINSILLC